MNRMNKQLKLIRSTKVVLLAGVTGAGKDAIKKRLLKNAIFSRYCFAYDSSARINNGKAEEDGVDYHFIDQPTAMKCCKNVNLLRQNLSTVPFTVRQ